MSKPSIVHPWRQPGCRGGQCVSTALSLLFAAVALSGCAARQLDPALPDSVGVERIDSSRARITSVFLRDHAGRLSVSGRMQKTFRGHSPIPGHLHLEAIGADGVVLGEAVSAYRTLNPKMGTAEFSRQLPVPSDPVHRVRVSHHPSADSPSDAQASECRITPEGDSRSASA